MALRVLDGHRTWSGQRTKVGDREYKITHRVARDTGDTAIYGPRQVLNCAGLPQYGDVWDFDGDVDLWAFCLLEKTVTPVITEDDLITYWDVESTFSSEGDPKKCCDQERTDPLLEPDRVNGTSVKYTEEATKDRFGQTIKYSSHEQIRGSQVEFDNNRHRVEIEQNRTLLELALCNSMLDCLNDSEMWGMPARTVKLSDFHWEKKFYGQCEFYFVRKFSFDVDPRGFDRDIIDQGTKVLNGHWGIYAGTGSATQSDWVLDNVNGAPPDPDNPQHFIRAKDRAGENITMPLDGAGKPAGLLVSNGVRSGPFFISLQERNLGNPLTSDSVFWIRVVSQEDPNAVAAWVGKRYGAGELVTYGGSTWISLRKASIWDTPAINLSGANPWLKLGPLVDGGVYDATKTYPAYQYVRLQSNPTQEGVIHVEKYPDADLVTLLDLPTDLEA